MPVLSVVPLARRLPSPVALVTVAHGERPINALLSHFNPKEDSMTRFLQLVRSLTHREEAQDLLEYALLVALIALVAVGAVTAAGGSVNTIFGDIAAQI